MLLGVSCFSILAITFLCVKGLNTEIHEQSVMTGVISLRTLAVVFLCVSGFRFGVVVQ